VFVSFLILCFSDCKAPLGRRFFTEDLKKKLVEAEGENAKLKEAIAKKEEDLQLLGQHSALMECEASDASEAEDRVEAGLSKLSEEFMGLQAKYALL
jgi:chromosome segregation ATPase